MGVEEEILKMLRIEKEKRKCREGKKKTILTVQYNQNAQKKKKKASRRRVCKTS